MIKRVLSGVALVSSILTAQMAVAQSESDSVKRAKESEPVVVTAERPYTAASDRTFRANDFALRPRNSAQDLLRLVPGLVIAQHAGGGKAEQIFLRGFDCDHGTDVNVSVDDAPVNMISHGHGQGYADLHFVIPETVEKLDVVKGPYFARYGDLATAGVVMFSTIDSLKENLVKVEGGQFSTYRVLGLAQGPAGNGFNSYAGAEFYASQGYFDLPQDFHRFNLFAKANKHVGEEGILTGSFMGFGSKWNANGQIPERAVNEGLVDRFGSIDSTEGGSTSRYTSVLRYTTGSSSPFVVDGSYSVYHFQLFSDFTFYKEDPVRGDEIEQTDNRSIITARAEKLLPWMIGEVILKSRVGANMRNDDIDVGLYHDSARTRISPTVNALINETQVGPYFEQEVITSWGQIMAGMRADYLRFNVLDRLGNERNIVDQFVLSPKLNVALPLSDQFTLFANSGYGFHSNDARAVVHASKDSTIPKAFGAELGLRFGQSSDLIAGSVALWELNLESELVYSGDEGTTESSGRTHRQGIDAEVRVQPWEWLTIGGDATIAKGRFLDEPKGADYIPLAPEVTLTANAAVRWDAYSAALRLRHVGDRPANGDNSVRAKGYSVFDLSAMYRFPSFDLYLNVENLFNVAWNEAQFDTESELRGEASPISELHFTAGTPRSVRGGVAFHF